MTRLLKLLLTYQLKSSQRSQKTNGFTLIELLIGLILAFLIITPLLGFLISIMTTDRQEQAKANSEQEIQAALNYIARDLEQAIYIYDANGLANIGPQLPLATPANTTNTPVLVFWKRQVVPRALQETTPPDDAFVYSLVAYFQSKSTNCATSDLSCTTQIRRFQIDDGVPRKNGSGNWINPDSGFQSFVKVIVPNTAPGDTALEKRMNSWTKGPGNYDKNPEVLIDYIDQSINNNPPPNNIPYTACPVEPKEDADGNPIPGTNRWSTVPAVPVNAATFSFYACVDTSRTTAQVFMRGNALARMNPKTNVPTYNSSKTTFFPTASIRVKGRGLFNETESK
jgi:type II secretory pathway pseudopilin PulG